MAKVAISLPQDQLEYVDLIAEVSEVSRSEIFQWVINALMSDQEVEDLVFPDIEVEEGEVEEEEED